MYLAGTAYQVCTLEALQFGWDVRKNAIENILLSYIISPYERAIKTDSNEQNVFGDMGEDSS